MGLLDDAIREHLELKRRRGADASEISRVEQEALGPARRGPEPLEVPREAAAVSSEPAELVHPESDAPPPAPAAPEAAEEEVDAEVEQPTIGFDAADLDEAQRRPAPTDVPDEDVLEEAPEDGDHGEEDVLEETPEFLRETPEHDRSWFEQRPPRDFDFGG